MTLFILGATLGVLTGYLVARIDGTDRGEPIEPSTADLADKVGFEIPDFLKRQSD